MEQPDTAGGTEQAAAQALDAGEQALAAGALHDADQRLRDAWTLAHADADGAGDPLLAARIADAMVRLCLDGGDDLAAKHWLDRCEALRLEHAGPASPEAGRCWLLRARLLSLAGQDPRRAAGAWERAERLLHGTDRVSALLGLGQARLDLGDLNTAEQVLMDARQAALGLADDALLLDILPTLARLRSAQGQHERALDHAQDHVARVHRLAGPDGMPAADALLLLAGLSEASGDLESAVSAMDRAVATLGRVLGPDDPETTMAAAWLLALQGRLSGAPPVPD